MKVNFDGTKCTGYGICAELCPSMFSLDEFGFPELITNGAVPGGDEDKAMDAIAQCPEKALAVAS
ncbi:MULTISPECIES: ferredoxin [Sphingomonas]|uniref:ferredoxin n=1 Tax=Sphingomonas TaxID=13687 RepID=UPI0024136288|nr:ferredoxin [Sphingomonas echinoides]